MRARGERDYRDYVQDILDAINDIAVFIGNLSFEKFVKDKKTINAVVRSLEIIGEAAKNVPRSLKIRYEDIPWKQMAGMRDKLIHEYFGVDTEILWKVVKEELPPVKPLIKKMLEDLE
jgi:uncharacterized protein with HEPN domain